MANDNSSQRQILKPNPTNLRSATLLGVVLANGTAGLKSQQGTHLAADAAYCRTVGYEINVYNRYRVAKH